MSDTSRTPAGKGLSKYALSGLVLGAGGIAALTVSAIGYRLGWWQVVTALSISEWAAYVAALGLVVSAIGAVLSRPGTRRRGFLLSVIGIVASLPVVVMAMQWEYAARTYPSINDISTDTEDPPVFWDMPNPTLYPGAAAAALQRAAYPDLAPLNLGVAPDRAYALAKALTKDKGWEIVADEPKEGRIEAVDRSLLYGFRDEIVIRIAASGGGARVDLRSRSRIGRIDRGVNARRIRGFLSALKESAGKIKQ
ncbi:MAG: DUF1499 domain-containing protein [Pseudolabrys sp.]|nr:DUF1499 domain-containing protein [Pseudolabrys sp.]MDP2298952.1 DUF1499 domain-containing protein [Pseudolabrys sp.]